MFKKKRYIFIGNNNNRTIALYFDNKNEDYVEKSGKSFGNLGGAILIGTVIMRELLQPLEKIFLSENYFFLIGIGIVTSVIFSFLMKQIVIHVEKAGSFKQTDISYIELNEFLIQGKRSIKAGICLLILLFILIIIYLVSFYYEKSVRNFIQLLLLIPILPFIWDMINYRQRKKVFKIMEEEK